MLDYAIVQISGRQYKVSPKQEIVVDRIDQKDFGCDTVLLKVVDGKLSIGKPYLKETLKFKVLGEVKKDKIKVATYKAKANTRKVTGQRALATRILLDL